MKTETIKEDRLFTAAFAAVLLLRLFLVSLTGNYIIDATARLLIGGFFSEKWPLFYPHIWLPLHFYTIGFLLKITYGSIFIIRLAHVTAGLVSVIFVYLILKRIFNGKIGLYGAVLLLFEPSHSFYSNSTFVFSFFHLFLILAVYFFVEYGYSKKYTHLILSASILTIASGYRYEAWLYIPFFSVFLLLNKSCKEAILFAVAASVVPVGWLCVNYVYTGDMFWFFKYFAGYIRDYSYGLSPGILKSIKRIFLNFGKSIPISLLFAVLSVSSLIVAKDFRKKVLIAVLFLVYPVIVIYAIGESVVSARIDYYPYYLISVLSAVSLYVLHDGIKVIGRYMVYLILSVYILTSGMKTAGYVVWEKKFFNYKGSLTEWVNGNLSYKDSFVVDDWFWMWSNLLLSADSKYIDVSHDGNIIYIPSEHSIKIDRKVLFDQIESKKPEYLLYSIKGPLHETLELKQNRFIQERDNYLFKLVYAAGPLAVYGVSRKEP